MLIATPGGDLPWWELGHDTTIVETVSSVAASEAPGAANAQTKPKSFWSKMLS